MTFQNAYQYYLIEKENDGIIEESVRGSIIDEDKAAYKLISSFKNVEVGVDEYQIDDVILDLVGKDPKWPLIKLILSKNGNHKKWVSVFMPTSETVKYSTDGLKVKVSADGKPFVYGYYVYNSRTRQFIKKDDKVESFTLFNSFMERDEIIGIVQNLTANTAESDKQTENNKENLLGNTVGKMIFNDSVKEYFEEHPEHFKKVQEACKNNDADVYYDSMTTFGTTLRVKIIRSVGTEVLSGNELIKFKCSNPESSSSGSFYFSPKFNKVNKTSICGQPALELSFSKVKTFNYKSNYSNAKNWDMAADNDRYKDKSLQHVGYEASEKWFIC